MVSRAVNLKTRRNGKRWFIVSAYDGAEPLADVEMFATNPAAAGRTFVAALNARKVPWTRVRSYAYTEPSLDWEDRR